VHLPEAARGHLEAPAEDVVPHAVRAPHRPAVHDDAGLDLGHPGARAPLGGDRDDALVPRRDDLDARGARPPQGLGADGLDVGAGDEAGVDRLELVRAVPAQPGAAGGRDGELHAGAPAQAVGCAGHLLDLDVALHAGQALQLLGDQGRLEPALRRQVDVLPVAAAAAAGSGVRARPLDPVRGRVQHLDGVRPQEGAGRRGHDRPHPLARQRVPDEDDPPVRRPRHAGPARRHLADVQLEHRAGSGPVVRLDRRTVRGRAHRVRRVGRRTSPGAEPPASSSRRRSDERSW
jgi:hypothetical protein